MSDDIQRLVEGAIVHAAIKPPGKTSEYYADAASAFVEAWNGTAEQIDRPKGHFPGRLQHSLATVVEFVHVTPDNWGQHYARLEYLADRAGPDNAYRWMANLLYVTFHVPEARVVHEATADDGIYRRKLRKRRVVDRIKVDANSYEHKAALYENQDREESRDLARNIIAADRRIVDEVRNDKPRHASGKFIELFNDFVTRPVILNDHVESDTRIWETPPLPATANRFAREAEDKAEPFRGVFAELQGLSGRNAAAELNRRGIKTPGGGKWHQTQVKRIRERLARP